MRHQRRRGRRARREQQRQRLRIAPARRDERRVFARRVRGVGFRPCFQHQETDGMVLSTSSKAFSAIGAIGISRVPYAVDNVAITINRSLPTVHAWSPCRPVAAQVEFESKT